MTMQCNGAVALCVWSVVRDATWSSVDCGYWETTNNASAVRVHFEGMIAHYDSVDRALGCIQYTKTAGQSSLNTGNTL